MISSMKGIKIDEIKEYNSEVSTPRQTLPELANLLMSNQRECQGIAFAIREVLYGCESEATPNVQPGDLSLEVALRMMLDETDRLRATLEYIVHGLIA